MILAIPAKSHKKRPPRKKWPFLVKWIDYFPFTFLMNEMTPSM